MQRAPKRNLPPPKIQVITLSDAESAHDDVPPEKKAVKKEPALPSSSSASLRPPTTQSTDVKKLEEPAGNWEKRYYRACRKAREEQMRAERAEKLLDTKREVVDYDFGNDAEKSMMTQENTSLKKEVQDLKEREDNFIRMKREAHERVEELRTQWDEMEGQLKLAGHHNNVLGQANFALKEELDDLYQQREFQRNNEQIMAQNIAALEGELNKMKEKEEYANMLKHHAQQETFSLQSKIKELNGKLKDASVMETNLRREHAAIQAQLEDVRKKREDVKRASLVLAQTSKIKLELNDGEMINNKCMKGGLPQENAHLKKEFEVLKEREDQTHRMNYNLTKTNSDLIQELQCAREKESRVSSELGESVNKIAFLEAKITEFKGATEMKESESVKKIAFLEATITELNGAADEKQRELTREIESLKQGLNNGRRSESRNDDREKSHKIDSLTKELNDLRKMLLSANKKTIEQTRTIKELNKELESITNDSQRIAEENANKSISKLNREIFVLKEELEIMKKNENDANNCTREITQKSASVEAEINEMKGALDIEKSKANDLINEVGVLKGELDVVRKEGEDVKRSNIELTRENDYLKEAKKMNFSLVVKNSALTKDLADAKAREASMQAEHTHASAVLNYQLEQATFREQIATNMNRRLTRENVQLEKQGK